MSARTFKVQARHMHGDDVEEWQRTLLSHMRAWGWEGVPLTPDGDYGAVTRSFTSLVLKGHGIAQEEMQHGVTPALRIKVRNRRLSAAELARKVARQPWRIRMRTHFTARHVASPLAHVITDTWGYHPGVHDGVDIICPPNEPARAICDGIVRRVSDDWWGLGNPGGALGDKGDGIIIVESLTQAGPFRPGLKFGYGHAEGPKVRVGQRVRAGDVIGRAGFAVAWHLHFMVNDDKPVDGFYRGTGDRDPRPFLNYARKEGR
jgi:murein DD-endopeptidase MepM/ murein hydrolase activator NlpD